MTRIIRQRGPGEPPTRRQRPANPSTRVLRADQVETLDEAKQVLNAARSEALALVEQAEEEALAVRDQAAEAGRAELAALIATTRLEAARRLEQERDGLTRLAVRVAEKLLNEALALQPERVNRIVASCLRRATAAHRMEIRVNPDDQPLVQAALPRLSPLTDAELLVVQADAAVSRGGCVIASEHGELDGQLQTQLEAILRALEG
jgi:flagellar biosynthesis/type III secretory pathway protein FliH